MPANVVTEAGLKAGADLSAAANQFKGVKLDANGDVVLCDTQGEIPYGVLQNKPASGATAEVAVGGSPKIQAGAAFNEMDVLMVAADGQFIARTTAIGNSNYGFCIAKRPAAAAGDIVDATITHTGIDNPAVS
jgi:hypothetical protein